MVFPTIMNQTPNALRRLPMLAEAGTLAFCADLYGRQPADRADAHVRDFAMASEKCGIALATPAQFLRRSK